LLNQPDGHAASGASADASAEASPRGGLPSGLNFRASSLSRPSPPFFRTD